MLGWFKKCLFLIKLDQHVESAEQPMQSEASPSAPDVPTYFEEFLQTFTIYI